MIIWSPRVDQYVICKHHHKVVQVRFEDSIYRVHERCWGVSEPKGHHYELIMPIPGAKDSLRYIFIFDSELVIPQAKVDLRESPYTSELVEEVVYLGQRVTVFGCYLVQFPIVYAQPQSPILLFHE